MQEIHIKDSIRTGEPSKQKTEENPLDAPSFRAFTQDELIAFYHASYPGMQPTPAFTEAIKALQLAQESYVSGELSRLEPLFARAIILLLGLQDTLEREGLTDLERLHRCFADYWQNGLNKRV